ncbi:hypothetical protein VTL71DRAFT_8820 [Oculimacula yallundae]|uniref:Uncharacterized protein n=1 Tax=Oculimacula yallundae TaxID=86028 RepID=A0ABR4CYN7_9HELO
MPLSPSKTKTSSLTPNNIPTTIFNPKHRANTPARRTISARDISTGTSRNSSGQVWAEDYYALDIGGPHQGVKENPGIPSPPPAATLSSKHFPKSGLSSEEESYPAKQSRTHQRTLTALLPFRTNPNEPESPTKVDIEGDFMATLTGDKEGVIKVADRRAGLSSWFTGSSAPVTVGVSIVNQEDTSMVRETSPQRPATKLQKRATEPIATSPKANNGGMFNFFSQKSPAKSQTVQIPAELNDDEFLTLDVTASLFPNGEPSAQDPFSPAAFKNLLMNAEGLLLKLQTAYKIRTLSLHELSAEKEAMSEELEEAETRAKCLKSQLDDMAHQMSMKDTAIAELAAELAAEKQARAEEKLAREQSIALVSARAERDRKHGSNSNMSIDTTGEDLGISASGRRRNRTSGGSSSDSGSDFEADSVFDSASRSRSPTSTFTMSSVSIAETVDSIGTPEIMQASVAHMVPNPGMNPGRPKLTQQKSTFQKILSGMGSTPVEEVRDPYDGIGMGEEGCSNCCGKDASMAWDAVGLMRAENKGLKERVGELEIAVEGALDACNGLF